MRVATFQDLINLAKLHGFDVSHMSVRGPAGGVKKSLLKKIPLEKGMYDQAQKDGITLSDLLEDLDPSENYPNCSLDAFQRQLAVRNLNIAGRAAVVLEEWYNDPDSRVLFPEFINIQVKTGMLMGRYTLRDEDLIATTTTVNSGTYLSSIIDETQDISAGIVGQGAEMPTISIVVGDETIKLKKHGLVIKQTYEHIRRLRANKMAVFFQLAGFRMMLDMTEDAVSVVINGDGNSNSAPVDSLGALGYDNFIDWLAEFEPYELDLMAAQKTEWAGVFKIPEFKDSIIAQTFINTGMPLNPFGSPVKRHDPSSEILANKVLGVNKANALERVEESAASLTETEKLITSQWQNIAISKVVGYARLMANGARVWDLTEDLP